MLELPCTVIHHDTEREVISVLLDAKGKEIARSSFPWAIEYIKELVNWAPDAEAKRRKHAAQRKAK